MTAQQYKSTTAWQLFSKKARQQNITTAQQYYSNSSWQHNSKHHDSTKAQQHRSTTARHHNSITSQQHNSMTAIQYDSTTAWQHNSMAAIKHTSALAWKHESTTAWQHNSTAAQQHDSTTARQQSGWQKETAIVKYHIKSRSGNNPHAPYGTKSHLSCLFFTAPLTTGWFFWLSDCSFFDQLTIKTDKKWHGLWIFHWQDDVPHMFKLN